MERHSLGVVLLELVEPCRLEVQSVDQDESCVLLDDSRCDELLDLPLRLLSHPVVDLVLHRLWVLLEVDELQAALVDVRAEVEEVPLVVQVALSVESVGDGEAVQLEGLKREESFE